MIQSRKPPLNKQQSQNLFAPDGDTRFNSIDNFKHTNLSKISEKTDDQNMSARLGCNTA